MKNVMLVSVLAGLLSACALTPQQQAERDAKRVKAEQALQVKLAHQCDPEAAELMAEQFNPPLERSAKAQKAFEKRYVEKVQSPVFQACYKLALENYKAQAELELLRDHYYDDYPRWGRPRFCYSCW